ncbi:hypothetical protein Goshw_010630 [Gossypium schwendimanii]|uniref:Uncharacterized protein n=1 Tax=Gossypium schwendimanii TaxID=34291 RepID=A0A7J9N5M6_GOSSC|nr:hypothetical protein [Gossypium schwendimanii]
MNSLCENTESEKSITEELIPKKVHFRNEDVNTNNNMLIDTSPEKSISWRDMFVGQSSKDILIDLEGKDDLDILDGDIQKTFVDGVPSISFSDRIHKILIQEEMVGKVVKLDMNTDSRTRGRFARLAVYVDLEKPLNSETPSEKENTSSEMASEFQNTTKVDAEKEHGNFGPWMIIEKKSRRKIRDNTQNPLNDL